MDSENPAPDDPRDRTIEAKNSNQSASPEANQRIATSEFQKVEKELGSYERSTLRWTIVIVVINAITCLFLGLQWHEIKSSSFDTHTLSEQAKKQADKMSNMSDAADKIRQAAENMVIQDQRIADNAQNAMEASSRQSQAALDTSISSFRRDQRPYLVADIPTFNQATIVGNERITANVTIANIGRTPARKIFRTIKMSPYHASDRKSYVKFIDDLFVELREKDKEGRKEIESAKEAEVDVAPQAKQFSTSIPIIIPTDDVAALVVDEGPNSGKVSLFYVGVVSYTDSFGTPYKTEFCYFYIGTDLKLWHICDNHNTIQ